MNLRKADIRRSVHSIPDLVFDDTRLTSCAGLVVFQKLFAVLDFKTGSPSEEKSEMYARQLQAYAVALENPAEGELKLSPVSKLGLLYFIPDKCEQLDMTRQNLEGKLAWIPIERNDSDFMKFLQEVVCLLDGPLPDPQPNDCDWCSYLYKTGNIMKPGQLIPEPIQTSIPSCPKCNGTMQLKTGKYGEFWSCVNFPECRGTRNK